MLTHTQQFSENSEKHALRCVLREAHLQEMAEVKVKIIVRRILDEIRSWNLAKVVNEYTKFVQLFQSILQNGVGEKQDFIFKDDNGNTIDKNQWGLQIITDLSKNKVVQTTIDFIKRALATVFGITFK
jgi:hypothetical protein